MLKALIEWLEREYPVLVTHPWAASAAIVVAALTLAALWLTTAWRLGKWYYTRELQALRAENEWLRYRVEVLRRTIQERVRGRTRRTTAQQWRRDSDESPSK